MARERSVGEVFSVDGVDVVVVPDIKGVRNCKLCVCYDGCFHLPHRMSVVGECVDVLRSDGVGVHFERFNDGHHLTRHLNEGKKSPIATDREQ